MPPKATGSTPTSSVAEEYSILNAPRPFKNPYYKRDAKRSRSMKQIMATERERVDTLAKEKREKRAARRAALEAQGDPSAMLVDEEDNVNGEEVVTYASVEAPPSLVPQKKYCDVTGLIAPYIDPKSTLRYHNIEVYDVVKTFGPSVIQSYLGLRGKGAVLR